MSHKFNLVLTLCLLTLTAIGCGYVDCCSHLKNRVCSKVDKICLGRDRVDTDCMPILEVARCVTDFEDHLRRDGTISTKSPDVWTDSNLMHSIQEFDQEMAKTVGNFTETVQAFISESDRQGLLSELEAAIELQAEALAQAQAGSDDEPASTSPSAADLSSLGTLNINAANQIFSALSAIPDLAKPKAEFRIEPTERERQQATFINVNQALRRGKMGGDNTRRAGYGLYLFRIPITVLPGEETSQGYSAVANFRAKLVMTPADVRYTLPRMAIAELVELLAPKVHSEWNTKPDEKKSASEENSLDGCNVRNTVVTKQKPLYATLTRQDDNQFQGGFDFDPDLVVTDLPIQDVVQNKRDESRVAPDAPNGSSIKDDQKETGQATTDSAPNLEAEFALPAPLGNTIEETPPDRVNSNTKFTKENILQVRDYCKNVIGLKSKPKIHELRTRLFDAFVQISIHLQKLHAFDIHINGAGNAIQVAARQIEIGKGTSDIGTAWKAELEILAPHHEQDSDYANVSWLVARHCGLTDLNIKRLVKSLCLKREMSWDTYEQANQINFFSEYQLETAARIWQSLVEVEFPLQVFTLEPLIEEQNLLDSQSRLRQMQVALAYSVASGAWNVRQRVELAKELARDSVAIGINRTHVGFVHGMDTFGWYFYPRVQSPEIRNRGVIGNVLFPQTRAEDAKTYKLEPGVRECEVLIAMPSFVTQVAFDVTTNWERLNKPGKSKRSYEELILEGCKLQELRQCLCNSSCVTDCRPGDLERLNSRIDQLENMLAMQTHVVDVPFDYLHPAGELFDQGERSLKPEIFGYHGLTQISPKDDKEMTVEFFITGKNFHPTLTHVIVEGNESHSLNGDGPTVEILSRQLIRVETKLRPETLNVSQFEVRVGTPSGMSSPLYISKGAKKVEAKTPSAFDWDSVPKFEYHAFYSPKTREELPRLKPVTEKSGYLVKPSSSNPINESQLLDTFARSPFRVKFVYEVTFDDESKRSFKSIPRELLIVNPSDVGVQHEILTNWFYEDLSQLIKLPENRKGTINVTSYLAIDDWPMEKMDKSIEIKLVPCNVCTEKSEP